MSRLFPPAPQLPLLGALLALPLLVASVSAQINVTESVVASGDYVIGAGRVNYKFTIEGARTGASQAEARVEPYYYIIYAEGIDIYGNRFFQQLEQGLTNTLYGAITGERSTPATNQTFEGSWSSGDVTLLNYFPLRPGNNKRAGSYRIVLQLYGNGLVPATAPADDAAFLAPSIRRGAGEIYWYTNNGPDLQMQGVTYNAGTYEGGNIIRMTTTWNNLIFPLIPGELYKVHNMLTENASVDWRPPTDLNNPPDAVTPDNDDFLLSEYTLSGDRPVESSVNPTPIIPDGRSKVRQVEVSGTPGLIPTYGIRNTTVVGPTPTFYESTLRLYQPQPDDGYLDVGESVSVTVEIKIPQNYAGTYFVAARVDPENTVPEPPDLVYLGSNLRLEITPGQPDNNTFVSNASAKITIDGPSPAPTVEAVSSISYQDGEYVQGGGETSNQSSVSSDGNVIAFASAARNLLVPPALAEAFITENGRGADMVNFPDFFDNSPPISEYLTAGQQIFYRLRQTREIYLASGVAGEWANADCFNPNMNSEGGEFIAFDSRASNLGVTNTGNRSFIYVANPSNQTITVVSRNSNGDLANGDSFNPSMSATGRFVTFESVATNLDPNRPIPSGNSAQQIYLHDRDVDADGVFDEPGNIATYLVSVSDVTRNPSQGQTLSPAVSLNDTGEFMYVAYVSFQNMGDNGASGSEQVYRASIRVAGGTPGFVANSVRLVSANDDGTAARKVPGAPNNSIEPAVNNDGTQIAFSSSADNLVLNPLDGTYVPTFPDPADPLVRPGGDYNKVPDVFVRDFVDNTTVRVSESIPRVATGTISFVSPTPGLPSVYNLPQNNPANGDKLEIYYPAAPNGPPVLQQTFVFSDAPAPVSDVEIGPDVPIAAPAPILVITGQDVRTTRDNLVDAINNSGLDLVASATTPPNTEPNMGYSPSIYLRSLIPGEDGNGAIKFVPVAPPVPGEGPVVVDTDLTGGGTQADDAVAAVQGVPAGSNQPTISGDGRIVAFRSIAGNLEVQKLTPENNIDGGPPYDEAYPPSPRQGELLRPDLFPASNVYLHNRQVDPSIAGFDQPENISTAKVSFNNFGYPTTVSAQQASGLGAFTTAANQAPSISGNGRFISFSSGSEVYGGLVFGRNNLEPLDFQNAPDVYLFDQQTIGIAPPPTESRPEITITSPANGLRVPPQSTIAISANAIPKLGKTIASLQFYVNGAPVGAPITSEPYALLYTLANPGRYVIRAVATDSRGITSAASVTVEAAPPIGEAPTVALTVPVSNLSYFVVGSQLTFNALASDPNGLVPGGVKFFLNGTPLPGVTQGSDGTYFVNYRVTNTGTFSLFVSATDSDGNTSLSEVKTLDFVGAASTFPIVEILPLQAGTPTVAGGEIALRARASFYGSSPTDSFVWFYGDGVYLGQGELQADGTYLLAWQVPSTPRAYTKITANLVAVNSVTILPGEGENLTRENFVVVPSSNFTTINTIAGTPPTVAMTSPETGTSAPVGTGVLLQATASVPGGQGVIERVEFYQNGNLIAPADTSAPYSVNFVPPSAGQYSIVAVAYSTAGLVAPSTPVIINGVQGTPPTVSITNPANTTPPAEVTPGIPVTVTVNAADSDGSVSRVDLLVNGAVVGFSTQAPYIFTDAGQFSGGTNTTFTPPSEGTYVIVARATDNLGNVTDSAPVTVRAKSAIPVGVAPTVQITQPIGEIYYVTGSSLFLNARATDAPPGEVDPDSVDFTVNGLAIPGAVIGQIGNDYGVRYTPTTPFTIDTIRAQATDDDGNTTYSQPNYTVLTLAQAPLPQVQVLDLLPSTPLDAGGVIKLRAEAFFPPTANTQARVEFYANNVYVGTATQDATNPRLYTLDWESPETPAAYVIEARAMALNFQTNVGEGNVIEYFGSVISDNNIAVNTIPGTAPDVEITAPANGSTVAVGQPLTVRATAFVPSPSGPSVTEVTSPQAGTVTSVRVAVGQAIIVGTPLVDIQVAPGFSGTVSSTLVGTVKSIKVVPGSAVSVGSVLLEVIPVTTVTAPSAAAGGTVTSVVPVGTLVQTGSPLVGVTLPGGFTGTINSPITGVVTQVSVAVGSTLTAGQNVARIEPGGGSSGTIASVEFYANGVLLGVDNAAPYSIDFTPTSVGLYNLNAIAYSNAGLVSTSATISVSATLGSAPVVTITRPTQATATATLGSGATAGQVTSITVGQSGSGYSTAPLVTLSAPPPGGVQATATAVLGTGASAGRVTDYITNPGVGYTAAPTVTVAAPSGTLGSSLLVQASVSDSDGIITQVEFLVNGLVVQTLTAAPYSYNLPLASTGTYLLQVRATDNSGNVGVSAVEQFLVNQGSPPVVSITSPANGANIPAGQPVTVTANASDTDGSVVSVTFFQNGTQIGEPDTQAPYSATFTPGSPGQYTLVALAQDNSGNLTQSTPVVVTVPSTVVTTSVVSPTSGASFTLGTPVILTATASTTAGATISSVRFEVNNQPVGAPITSAPYTASFVPTALGSYSVRAIATDTSGGTGVSTAVTFTVNNPVGSAPSIWLSQPSQGNYLTAGSSVFLNFTTFDTEGEIDPATIRIFVNGVALTNPTPQRIGPDGNTFGVRWNPGVTGTYVVSAQVSDFDGNTASSGTSAINVLPAQKTVPQITIEPFVSASQYISVGLPIELRAKAKFFANTDAQVEFYANGVFVGTAVAGASNSDGSVSYSFVWTPEVAGGPITLTARAVGINFVQTEFVTPPGSTDTTIIERNVYASTISSNRPTPPVTDLTINEVPADPVPGSNEAFVKFIFPTIFNRPATYAEYIYYVNQLQPFGNPAASTARATVIQELMGTVEYNSSYNVVYSFYYRLGLSPTRAAAATQIDVVKNNTAAETGFATHTTSQPQAPNLPTLGMSLAAQNLLGTLGSQTTVGLTPNVTKPLSQFSNIEFLNWLIPKLGGQAFNPSTMNSSMNTYSPQLRRQGGALAFLTQLYATYAANDQNITDSRPSAVGPVNPNFRQDNFIYDAKLKGITINFLLTGVWNISTAPLSNTMLAALLTSSSAAARPVVTSGNAAGEVGEYFTYQIEATNSPGGYTASNLPAWLRLNPETGLLTGRPALGDDGIYPNVKIGAQNWAGEGTKFITIDVAPAPTAMSMSMLRSKYGYPSDGALAFGMALPTANNSRRSTMALGPTVEEIGTAQISFKTVPGGVELVWTQLKNPVAYGVTYQIQQTAGLNGWTSVMLAPGQSPQPVIDGVSVPDTDDYERVRVVLPVSGSKGFYRVKATVPR